jgi:cysteine-rich repeat protein
VRVVDAVNQGAGVTTVACADGVNNIGVAVDTAAGAFRFIPCGASFTASAVGAFITLVIEGETPGGTLANPGVSGPYAIIIMNAAGDCGGVGETCALTVSIIDAATVSVTAAIVGACGNGVLEWGEGCDDGNILPGDGCSAECAIEGGGPITPPDTTPPAISGISVTSITKSAATIGWYTNEGANSLIRYGLTSGYGSTFNDAALILTHSFAISGLSEGVLYHYQVCSSDGNNNQACSTDATFTTLDETPPVISNVVVSNITSTGAVVTWTTDENATSYVDYGSAAPPPYTSSAGQVDSVTSHSVTLSGLTPSTTYNYRVRSGDAAANESFVANATFATVAPPDSAPPTITAVAATSITVSGSIITWTTNEAATSYVDYGPTVAYGSTAGDAVLATSHSVSLTGLSENTTYNFRVRSADVAANEAISANSTFKTLDATAPLITLVATTNITTSGARITWTTNEAADSLVEYGPTVAYGSTKSDAIATTSHQVDLTGLAPDATYNYRVKSKDAANNLATSGNFTFKTLKPPPPTISSIQVTNITQTGARILWTTDTAANSTVNYGPTTAYGSTVTDAANVTNHLVVLTGLTKGATYNFRVRSTDVLAQETFSGNNSFATLPDTASPANVTGFTVTVGESRLTLEWTNPVDADFQGVKVLRKTSGFPINQNDGTVVYTGAGTSHVDLGLTNGVSYYYAIFPYDDVPNYASGAVANGTPMGPPDTTAPGEVTGFTAVSGDGQITLAWTNPVDADFQGVKIVRKSLTCPATSSDGTVVYDGIATSRIDLGLANGTLYCYKAYTYDAVPNMSAGVEVAATPLAPADTTPPANVAGFTAVAGDAVVQLIWTNPGDADFAGVRVMRKVGSAPIGPADGNIVYDGMTDNRLDAGLSNNTTYHYGVFAYDARGNFASGTFASATPTASAPPPPPPSCTDSDGGKIYEVQGTAVDGTGTYNDACAGPGAVAEYFCASSAVANEVYVCGAGKKCSAGKCVVDTFQPSTTICGNGICEGTENSLNCAVDCPVAPVQPPVVQEQPSVTEAEKLNFDDLQFYATSSRIRLRADAASATLTVFPSMTVAVYLPSAAIIKPIRTAYVNYQNSAYMMQPTRSYEGQVTTSSALGRHQFSVIVNYEDDTSDTVIGFFNIVPFGQVYETVDDIGDVGISGARVTLLQDMGGGNFGLWNGAASGQANPQITGDGGRFSFIVEPGIYKLKAEKEGYRDKETLGLPINQENVVAPRLNMIKLPPPPAKEIQDVLAGPGTAAEKAADVAQVITDQAVYVAKGVIEDAAEVIRNPIVDQQVQSVAAPTAAAVAVMNAAAVGSATATGIPYLMYLLSFITHPALLFGRRRRKWGIVFNALTKLPVDLAIVRLLDAKTGRILRSAVTDKDGRYFFIVAAGEYKLAVSKIGCVFPTEYLKMAKEDAQYVDLYHGEVIRASGNAAITVNIPVDPVTVEKTQRHIVWTGIGRRATGAISILSILAMAAAAIINPSIIVLVLLALNIVIYIVFRRLSLVVKPKNWGIVYDKETGKPIRNALARIFESKFNKLLETQITDNRGRYAFLVGRNVYYVTFEKPGYQKEQKGPVDLHDEQKVKEGIVGMNVRLGKAAGGAAGKPGDTKPGAQSEVKPPEGPSKPPGPVSPIASVVVPAAPPVSPVVTPPAPAKKIPWELQMLQNLAKNKPAAAPVVTPATTPPVPIRPATPPAIGMAVPRTKLVQDAEHAHPETKLLEDSAHAHPEVKPIEDTNKAHPGEKRDVLKPEDPKSK